MAYNILSSVSTSLTNLIGKFVRTISLSFAESSTFVGERFNQEFDVTLSGGEVRYFLYELPSGSDITVGLQNRIFKSHDGSVDLEILWGSTGFTSGTPEQVFNEYNKYADNNQFIVSEITAPTVEGVVRETDFLIGTGQGANSSGDVSSELGFRLYKPDTFFIAKVTNTEVSNNRVILGYSWVEIPRESLSL